ncbi:hypothetical protein L9F63_022354, partial [Diploptera punctata]
FLNFRMGKIRRERHKYHVSAAGSKTQNCDTAIVGDVETSPRSQLTVPDNPFAGIDISFEDLNKTLKDSDTRSVISLKSTTSKAPVISKKEKRKQRHETFLKKLQAAYQTRKEKGKKVLKLVKNTKPLSDNLPLLDLNLGTTEKKDKVRQVKHRSIPKAKKRKKNMMQDIALFKNLLSELQEHENPEDVVMSRVQKQVLNDASSSQL